MSAIIFDALGYIEELVKSGVNENQAKAQIKILQKAIDEVSKNKELVTKFDLSSELKDLEIRLIKWVIASQISTIVILTALLKFL